MNVPTHAPSAENAGQGQAKSRYPNTEPFYINIYHAMGPWRDPLYPSAKGGEYITFWYLAQIPEGVELELGTQMADEAGYVTHLFTFEEALEKMESHTSAGIMHRCVLSMAKKIWECRGSDRLCLEG